MRASNCLERYISFIVGAICFNQASAFTMQPTFSGLSSPLDINTLKQIPLAATSKNNQENMVESLERKSLPQTSRRSLLSFGAASVTAGLSSGLVNSPLPANAQITKESNWPLWTALPVAPYSKRKTIRYEVGPGVWAFDQLIGIYYVHVPIRMTVVKKSDGLLVFAPIAPTRECLSLLQELIDVHGPITDIILPSVAVEHKVNAGPFARAFPTANFYIVDKQYAFPLNLPNSFLGLPSWTKPLPRSSTINDMWGGELEHEVLTVKPGIGSM